MRCDQRSDTQPPVPALPPEPLLPRTRSAGAAAARTRSAGAAAARTRSARARSASARSASARSARARARAASAAILHNGADVS